VVICPAVVGALEELAVSLLLSNDRSFVSADVMASVQSLIDPTHNHEGIAYDLASEVISRVRALI
jgi:hypothetical protein